MVKMNRSTLKRRTTAAAARRAPKPIISKQSPRAKRCSENISQGSRNKEALQNSLKCCKRLVVRVRKLPMTKAKNDDVTAASQKRQEKDLSRGVMANEKEKENEGATNSKQTTINTAQDKQLSDSVDNNNCLSNGKEALATTKRSQRKLLRGGKSRSIESGNNNDNEQIDRNKKTDNNNIKGKKRNEIEEIYNFSTQSFNSIESRNDPAADIIQKLIKEKKVRVAKSYHQRQLRVRKAAMSVKSSSTNNPIMTRKVVTTTSTTTNTNKLEKTPPSNLQSNNDAAAGEEEPNNEQEQEKEIPNKEKESSNVAASLLEKSNNGGASGGTGTFSRLAQNVLLRESNNKSNSGETTTNIPAHKKKLELLRKVHQIISTPKNQNKTKDANGGDMNMKMMTGINDSGNLSPIPNFNGSSNKDVGGQSTSVLSSTPWRLDLTTTSTLTTMACLPKTFLFSRNSNCLPSYSSDFIASTPRKQQHTSMEMEENTRKKKKNDTASDERSSDGRRRPSSPPSILLHDNDGDECLNDSDAENIPPFDDDEYLYGKNSGNKPKKSPPNQHSSTKEGEMMKRSQSTTVTRRRPLQDLNITEVINLPNWRNVNTLSQSVNNHGGETTMMRRRQCSRRMLIRREPSPPPTTSSPGNLFGFDDYLEHSNSGGGEGERSTDSSSSSSSMTTSMNQNIHPSIQQHSSSSIEKKLRALRKWRPQEDHTTSSLISTEDRNCSMDVMSSSSNHLDRCLFNMHPHRVHPGQRMIKDMLCSTAIDENRNSSRVQQDERNASLFKDKETVALGQGGKESAANDVECSINEKDINRTYERPYKRKRRLYQNKFVVMLDSDNSTDEEKEKEEEENAKNLEWNKRRPEAKRRRKDQSNPELEHFVQEFNAMCDDVDKYELQIE